MRAFSNRMPAHRYHNLTVWLVIITILIFILEVVTPSGMATSTGYVFVVLLCYFDNSNRKAYFFSALCTVLVMADYFYAHDNMDANAVLLANRLISISCIGMAAVFVTNFKKLNQEHRNSETLLKSILSSANESVMVVNEAGQIVYNNESAVKMFGFEQDDLKGSKFEDLVPEEFRNKHTGFLQNPQQKLQHRPMGTDTAIKARRKNGTEFPVDISLGQFYTNEGAFFTCFIMDISLRKEVEAEVLRKKEALKNSENFLQSIIRSLPLYIQVCEPESMTVILENKKIQEILDFCDYCPVCNIVHGRHCRCISKKQAKQVVAADEEARTSGNTVVLPEVHLVTPGGGEKVLELIKAPILDSKGAAAYLIHICEDVTSRVLAQRELKKKNELLLESQEIGNVGSFESDLACKTITLSKEMIHIAGLQPQHFYPFNYVMDFIHPEDKERVKAGLRSAIAEKVLCDEKYRIIRSDNGQQRYVWLKAKTIFDDKGKASHIRGVISDITELKKAEENLVEYIKGLEQMMFMTSHKVRLPVANILGLSNILEQSLRSPEVLKKLVSYLHSSAQSLDAFTKELAFYMEQLKTGRVN